MKFEVIACSLSFEQSITDKVSELQKKGVDVNMDFTQNEKETIENIKRTFQGYGFEEENGLFQKLKEKAG